jgi:hypothetical protein
LRGLVTELAERGLKVDYRTVWEFVPAEKLSHKKRRCQCGIPVIARLDGRGVRGRAISRARLRGLRHVAQKTRVLTVGQRSTYLQPLFAALQGAKRHERCGIGTIIPPILPPGIGGLVCKI